METLKKYIAASKLLKDTYKEHYEVINALNRWMLSNANKGFFFPSNVVTESDIKFAQELEEKTKDIRSIAMVRRIKDIKGIEPSIEEKKDGWYIEGQYMGKDKNTAIRYYPLGASGSLFWTVPGNEYDKLVKDGPENVIEGFASPLNHHFKNYCSLFSEDGSLGNFFDQNLDGYCVVVNPPFALDILNEAAIRCRQQIMDAKKWTRIIFICPTWHNAKFYMMMKRSEYLQDIKEGYHKYENMLTGEIIDSSFKTSWFILDNLLLK